jgi:hypothetical protein
MILKKFCIIRDMLKIKNMKNLMLLFLLLFFNCSKKDTQEVFVPIVLEKHDYACIHSILYELKGSIKTIKYLEDVLNVTEDSIKTYAQKETYTKLIYLYLPDTAFFTSIEKCVTYSQIIPKDVKPIFTK